MTESNSGSGGRVLLVDDNPTNLKVLNDTLKGRGYKLRIAKSGEQALQVAEKSRPDLILLDIMMPPGIDGYETIRRLKASPETKETPVIFLSALNDTRDKVKGLELGAVDFISKPFQADEVIARVDRHLTMHLLRQELRQRNRELETANERMKRDLEAAARVQRSMLPASLPEDDRVRIGWQYHPCDELAGDALNAHRLSQRHISLYIVDVRGHGVPSALLSVSVTRSLEPTADLSSLVTGPDGVITAPEKVAQRLNTLYPMESNAELYFTMIYGVLDLETRCLRFVQAGHPGPILIRREGAPEQINAPSLLIGAIRDATFSDSEIQLMAGDRLYLVSDGLCEETDESDEEFTVPRLIDSLAARADEPLQASLEGVRRDLVAWHGSDEFSDDFSILGIEIPSLGRTTAGAEGRDLGRRARREGPARS